MSAQSEYDIVNGTSNEASNGSVDGIELEIDKTRSGRTVRTVGASIGVKLQPQSRSLSSEFQFDGASDLLTSSEVDKLNFIRNESTDAIALCLEAKNLIEVLMNQLNTKIRDTSLSYNGLATMGQSGVDRTEGIRQEIDYSYSDIVNSSSRGKLKLLQDFVRNQSTSDSAQVINESNGRVSGLERVISKHQQRING